MSGVLMILLTGFALAVFLPGVVFAPIVFALWLTEKLLATLGFLLASFYERPCNGGSPRR